MNNFDVSAKLKGCPSGMPLDCTCADNVVFDKVIEYDQIQCLIGECKMELILDKYGQLRNVCCPKCVIFPKDQHDWITFQRPFKDGDIVFVNIDGYKWFFIYKDENNEVIFSHFSYCLSTERFYISKSGVCHKNEVMEIRFATEEEKEILFKTIKDNGYKWDEETKTLEKLVPNKFDISTLQPFDKVLIRDTNYEEWGCSFYSHYASSNSDYHFWCGGINYGQCIPYNDDTKYLLGTNNDCNEYYKNW